jgi:hypothetical protein
MAEAGIITIVSIAFTVLLTVGILFFVFRFIRKASGDPKLLAEGIPAPAMILSIAPTGTIVNNIYYQCEIVLRIQPPGGQTYDASTRQLIPITSMAMLPPGTHVQVRIDKTDPAKVAIDFEAGVTPAGMAAAAAGPTDLSAGALASAFAAGGAAAVTTGSAADLLRSGQRVLGVLTEFADTGKTARSLGVAPSRPEFIDDPQYVLTLQLHVPNTTPIEAKVIHRVPRTMAGRLQMGMQLNCAVNPANPTRDVAVDWGDIPV